MRSLSSIWVNLISPRFSFFFNCFNRSYVIDGCRHSPRSFIRDFPNCASENFSRSSLWKLLHKNDTDKLRKGADILANFRLYGLFKVFNLFRIHRCYAVTFQTTESQRTFTSGRIVKADDSTFDNTFVLIDDFFKAAC